MKINFNSRKIFGGIIGIVLFSLCIIGITFAFYSWRNTSDTDVAVGFTVDDLGGAIIYSRDNGDGTGVISGNLTEENNYTTSATITLYKKDVSVNLLGHIYLDIKSIANELGEEQALKWAIYEGSSATGTPINSGNFNGESVNSKIPLDINIPLSITETQYTIAISLDIDEVRDNSIVGKNITAEIVAEVSATMEGDANPNYEFIGTESTTQVGYYESLYINSISNDGYEITATAKDFLYNITSYAVTTSSIQPSSWTTLTSASEQTINYTVSSNGTYYVWVKNSNGDTVSKSIVIDSNNNVTDISDVTITVGDMEDTYFNSDSSISIPLIINSSKDVTDNLTSDEIKVLINDTEVTNVTKTLEVSNNNNKFYTLILDGLNGDGSLGLSFNSDVVKNSDGEGNNSTSINIGTIDNTKPVCTFGSVPTVTRNVNFDVDLTCTDTGSGLVWSGITTDRLTTLDNDLKIIAVSTPTAVTNGYKYTVTLNTNTVKSEGYSLILKGDTVWDNSGNYNDEVSTNIVGPVGNTYTVTFVKGDNVSSIGSTSLTCSTTGNSNTCEVTVPTITPSSGYSTLGWALSGSTKYIAPGEKVTVGGNTTYVSYVYDTEAPTASIESTANLKATSQTATLKCTDNVGVDSYYWGNDEPTDATVYTKITSTKNMSITQTISSAGIYYLSCKDADGNTSNTVTKVYNSYTVNNMLLNVTGTSGTYTTTNYTRASTNTYLAPNGTSLTLASIYTIPTGASSSTFKGISTGAAGTTSASVSNSAPTLSSNSTYSLWFDRNTYSITVSAGVGGSNKVISENNSTGVTATSGTTTSLDGVRYGEKIIATAIADEGHTFSEFSGLSSSNTSPVTVTTTEADTITANFTGNTYSATFYYVSGSSVRTASASCTVSGAGSTCNATIPTAVTGSTGQYGNSYVGLNTSLNTMNTSISGTAESVTLSANTVYYAVYRSGVSIYRPTSSTAASATTVYRNSYFTSSSSVSNVLSGSTLGTSSITSVSGLYGTLTGFSTAVNSVAVAYSSIDALSRSTATTVYAISTSTVTATFYYNSNTNAGSLTVSTTTASGVRTYYCSSTTTATFNNGSIDIPSLVENSVGRYNTPYYGVASSLNSHTSVTPTTATLTYYAIYGGGRTTGGTNAVTSVVNIYYPSSTTACSRVSTAYRNEFFTSMSAMSAVIGNSATSTSNLSVSVTSGYTFGGFATSANTTVLTYSTVAAAATSTATTLYAYGTRTVTATFYYNSNTSAGSLTVSTTSGTGSQTNYCTSTSSATTGNGSISVPSVVSGSVGRYNTPYYGVASSLNSHTSVTPTTATLTYYAIYGGGRTTGGTNAITSVVNMYYASISNCLRVSTAYRNEFFTSTSAMSTVIGNSATSTTNLTLSLNSGMAFGGFATSTYSTSVAYSSVAAAATSTATTLYAFGTSSVTATFYYNSNRTPGSLTVSTATATGNKVNYCTSTSSATVDDSNITVPTAVSNSVGRYNTPYYGVASSLNSHTSVTPTTETLTYYAIYGGGRTTGGTGYITSVVNIYYPSSTTACSRVSTAYRNEFFTSTSAMSAVIGSSATATSNLTVSMTSGYTLDGFATVSNSTINTYTTIASAATSTATTLYAHGVATVNVYFYGNSNTTAGSLSLYTRIIEGERSNYCTSTSYSTVVNETIDVPSDISGSVGKWNSSYKGVSNSLSSMTTTTPTTAYTAYYAVYSSPVSVRYPSSTTTCSNSNLEIYRNEYFTSVSYGGTMNAVIAKSQTSTSSEAISIDGVTLAGLSLYTNTTSTTSLSNLAANSATTFYGIVSDPLNVTFYYNDFTSYGVVNLETVVDTYSRTRYCTSSTSATTISESFGDVPSEVKNSRGPYNTKYSGNVATALNTMNGGATLSTNVTTYYAIYRESIIRNYYDKTYESWAIEEVYRNSYFTSVSGNGAMNTVLSSSQTGTSNVSYSSEVGPGSAGFAGLSLEADGAINYANASNAATAATRYANLYTIYKVYSVGSSCSATKYANTLEFAVDLASSGNTICPLVSHTDTSQVVIPSGKTIILDLNGKTISRAVDSASSSGSSVITNSGTLTIRGSNGAISSTGFTAGNMILNSGTLYIGASGATNTFTIQDNRSCANCGYTIDNGTGTLYMYGGTVTTNDRAITTSTGRAYIYGGNVTATNYVNPLTLSGRGTLQIGNNDGSVSTSSPVIRGNLYLYASGSNSINFYDGIIYHNSYPFANTSSTINTPSGYYPVTSYSSSKYITILSKSANYGISTGSSCGTYSGYTSTLQNAFNVSPSGKTICVLKNITDSSAPSNTNKTLTLNLNGHILTKTSSGITNNGTLTITGTGTGTTECGNDSSKISFNVPNVKLLTNSGTLNLGTSSSSNSFCIINSEPTLNNGYTIQNNDNSIMNVKGVIFRTYDRGFANFGNLNISGGIIELVDTGYEGTNLIAMYEGSNTIISGGDISSVKQNTIVSRGDDSNTTSTLKITGGSIENTSSSGKAINITYGGDVTISGGSIENTSGGDALSVSSTHQKSINISGGTITVSDGYALSKTGSGTVSISGGFITGTTSSSDTSKSLIYMGGSTALNIKSSARIRSSGQYAIDTASSYSGTITVNANKLSDDTTDPYGWSNANIVSNGGVSKELIHITSPNAKLNITNGYIYASNRAIYSMGTLTISGGIIRTTGNSNSWVVGLPATSKSATISGGVIWGGGTGQGIYSNASHTGTINISGGTIYCKNGNGISLNGTGTTKITKGYIESVSGYGLYAQNGSVEVNYATSGTALAYNAGAHLASVNNSGVYIGTLDSGKHAYFGYNISGYSNGNYAPSIYTGKANTYAIRSNGVSNSKLYSGRIYYVTSNYAFAGTIINASPFSGYSSSGTFSSGAGTYDSSFKVNYSRVYR